MYHEVCEPSPFLQAGDGNHHHFESGGGHPHPFYRRQRWVPLSICLQTYAKTYDSAWGPFALSSGDHHPHRFEGGGGHHHLFEGEGGHPHLHRKGRWAPPSILLLTHMCLSIYIYVWIYTYEKGARLTKASKWRWPSPCFLRLRGGGGQICKHTYIYIYKCRDTRPRGTWAIPLSI